VFVKFAFIHTDPHKYKTSTTEPLEMEHQKKIGRTKTSSIAWAVRLKE
jgi:hypothetical protein